jgi:hypothetical protein
MLRVRVRVEGAKLKATSHNVGVGMEMVYPYHGAEN